MTHLLADEDGPADAVVRLRERLGEGYLGGLMDCFYCLSLWVAAPFSPVVTRRRGQAPLAWLALSGAACLLERATSQPAEERGHLDQEGASDELLWEQAQAVGTQRPDAGQPDRRAATRGRRRSTAHRR
jgi:hypothetical protein